MQENDMTSMRAKLKQMDTGQLDELLNRELEKDRADGDTVRLILDVLWEREKDLPVEITPGVRMAWEKYRRNTSRTEEQRPRTGRLRTWVLRAASAAAVLAVLIFAFPQKAEADSLFEKIANLTDSIVEFFAPGLGNDNLTEYVFETDNPGLRQVYDAVVNLGVTDPVVPMWLPDGYELVECKTVETSQKRGLVANFASEQGVLMLKVDMYNLDVSHEYHWEGSSAECYERSGVEHTVMRNNDKWVVIWFSDSAECSITVDCQEDALHRILNSIYVMEEEQ
nr:hypothetical protein [Oscillospiraceae bacterium]